MVSAFCPQAFGASATANAQIKVVASIDIPSREDHRSAPEKKIQSKSYFEKIETKEKGQRVLEVIL